MIFSLGIRIHGGRESNVCNLRRRRGHCFRFNPLLASIDSLTLLSVAPNAAPEHRADRSPPGVRKIRQEQQNVENLADFSFPLF